MGPSLEDVLFLNPFFKRCGSPGIMKYTGKSQTNKLQSGGIGMTSMFKFDIIYPLLK